MNRKELYSWDYCEKYKIPYISISPFNQKYDEIFYDITNLPYNLEEVSEQIQKIYKSYIEFYKIPYNEVMICFDYPYFFQFYVLKTFGRNC